MLDHYVDIHCHVLPGVDDGAVDIEMSKRMLRKAYEDGIREIIVTPHNKAHAISIGKETIQQLTGKLQEWLDKEKISIQLHTGEEILYRHGLGDLLVDNNICTLADSFYLLVEFDPMDTYAYIKQGLQEIILAGRWPILAHIERYEALAKDNKRIEELINMGALMQVNARSVEGKSGFLIQRKILGWIKKDYISFIASDAHNETTRPQALSQSAKIVEKKFGPEVANKLFWENAENILKTSK